MKDLPPDLVSIIRQLDSQGLPTAQIAFMTHTDETTVSELLAQLGPQTAEEARAEDAAATPAAKR